MLGNHLVNRKDFHEKNGAVFPFFVFIENTSLKLHESLGMVHPGINIEEHRLSELINIDRMYFLSNSLALCKKDTPTILIFHWSMNVFLEN